MANYSDISIDVASSFSSAILVADVNGLPFNLTGYSARGQIRKSYSSLTAIDFTTSITDPLSGKVYISLLPAATKKLSAGRYVFDVEIYNISGDVTRIAEGQVTANPAVTRSSSSISSLSALDLSTSPLMPLFEAGITNYSASVPHRIKDVTVTPILSDPVSTMKINGISGVSGATTDPIVLSDGINMITIVVTAQDGVTTSAYVITLTRSTN